jgi:hypothetical protein
MTILRDKNRIVIELPDEAKAEAIEWLLTKVFSETVSTSPPSTHRSVRPTEAKLLSLEREREERLADRTSVEERVQRNAGPIFPWRQQ